LSRSTAEFKLQCAVVKHLDSAFAGKFWFTHVPGQTRDATEAHFNKVLGYKAGTPDLLILYEGRLHAIELKAPDGIVSSAQNKTLSTMRFNGALTAVCKSVKEVHNTIVGWGIVTHHDSIVEPDYRNWDQKNKDGQDFFKP